MNSNTFRLRIAFWAAAFVVFLIVPHVLGIVKTNMVVELAIASMFAISLNLLLSSGMMSFGHALYYGTGAYATALALMHIEDLPLIPALLIGGITAAILAAVLCPLKVRVSGIALIMLTLAFAQLMYVTCLKMREVTKGEDGLAGFPIPPLNLGFISFDMQHPTYFYYFSITIVAICIWVMWSVTRTPFGIIMLGIRDDQERIAHLGFWVPMSKAIIIVISAFFAGIAGALFGIFQAVVSVDSVLNQLVSFMPLMAILIGGVGTFIGPIIGSVALLLAEELTVTYTERVELVSGLIFIAVVLYAPRGILGFYYMTRGKWRMRSQASQGLMNAELTRKQEVI